MSLNNNYAPSDEYLKSVFHRVDKDSSGAISVDELHEALSNSSWKSFNKETVRLLFVLFDTNHSGNISFKEFGALWNFITKWEECFKLFDTNNTETIEISELNLALRHFGFRLSDTVLNIMMKKFNETKTSEIRFDNFIQCCVKLTNLTRAFRAYDKDSDGWVDIHFNQMLGILFTS